MTSATVDDAPQGDVATDPTEKVVAKTPFTAWWTLAVLFIFYILSIVDRQIIAMLVQPIKADLGLSDTQVSLLLGPAFVFSYALLGIPLGWLADRTSRRWVLFFGVSVWAAAAAAGGFARSFGQLALARAAVGAGEAALAPSAYSLIADNFPRHKLALAMAIYQSGLKVGTAAAYAIGGVLIHFADDLVAGIQLLEAMSPWQLVLIMTGAPGLVLAFLVFTLTEPKRAVAKAGEKPQGLGAFIRANAVLLALLMVGFGCIVTAANALSAWIPTFIERRYGWTPIQFGPWLSVMSMATAASLLFKGGIMDWLYSKGMKDAHVRFYTWLCIAAFPAVAALFWLDSVRAFLVLYGVLQILTLTFMVFLAPAVQIFTPTNLRGQVMAAFLVTFSIIGALGPVLVGLITDLILRDEQKIGVSLSIVMTTSVAIAIVLLRMSLPHMRRLMQTVDA